MPAELMTDIPRIVTDGGYQSINWVLAVALPTVSSALAWMIKLHISSLKDRINAVTEITIVLKEATEVIKNNSKDRQEVLNALNSFSKRLGKLDDA